MLTPFFLSAQISISGKIKDTEGDKVIFASVYLKSRKVFTHSLEDGSFSLKIDGKSSFNDTLLIRFIGYHTLNIPVYFQGQNIVLDKIILSPKISLLPEVSIIAPPPVEEIMKLAIKGIKKNYINEDTRLEGFYREISFENDICVMVDEAVINVDYSKYTNGVNVSKRFRDYYKNQATNLKEAGNIFRYAQFFPFYTSKEDKVYVPYGRKSHNLSPFKNNPSPYGGPNDVLAIDKVKFLYDFMDPKMFSKYTYKNLGKIKVDGVTCYKIAYTPKVEEESTKDNRVWHPISKKMKYPIFAGFIYISTKDYAVLSFEGQKYILTDFSIYRRPYPVFAYPDFISFKVSYRKDTKNRYVLGTVETEQIRTILYNEELIRYKSERLLNLYASEKKLAHDESQQFLYGNNTTLRNFVENYDEAFWKNYETSKHYTPLTPLNISQLEIKTPLISQFLDQNKTISDFERPDITEVYEVLKIQNDSAQYYHELKSKYDSILSAYIYDENQYYNAVMEKLKNYKRNYSYHHFYAFKDEEAENNSDFFTIDHEEVYSKIDTNNHQVLYSKETHEKMIDLPLLSAGKLNYFLEEIKLNHAQNIAVMHSEKGQISNHLNVFEYGVDSAFLKIESVTEFYWTTDSTLLYVQTDLTERPWIVLETNINTKETDTLFTLENHQLELSLIHDKYGTFLKVENKDETGLFILNRNTHQFEAKTTITQGINFNVAAADSIHIVFTEHGVSDQLRFGEISNKNYANLPVIYKSSSFVEEVKSAKDFILFTERSKGSYQLKALNIKTLIVKTIESIPKYASITLDKVSVESNEVIISVETAITPYCQIKVNLESNKLDTVERDFAADLFNSSNFEYKYEEIQINDSTSVPITILYKKELKDNLKGLLIKTYGAYGSIDFPNFNVDHLTYANAGIGVVFVHPRGSGEKGHDWYEGGKKLNKMNTFSEYIACVEHLKNRFKLEKKQIIGYGNSAGGLIMGVAANLRPDLFGALIFDKPYLNVLEVMSNPNLPLTTLEYSEFGDINDSIVYNYVKSYAPLENLKVQDYPSVLVLNKFHDMNSTYWNTAKYITKYRKYAKNKPLILMGTDLQAGHRGNIDGLIELDYRADMFAFIMYVIKNEEEHSK